MKNASFKKQNLQKNESLVIVAMEEKVMDWKPVGEIRLFSFESLVLKKITN